MTRRSAASKQKQANLGKPQVKKSVENAGKQNVPVGYQAVTRAGISHFIRVLPLTGAKGISIPDIVKKFRSDIAKLPKWKRPTGFPSDMEYDEYQSSLNAVYNWLLVNAPSAIPDTIADEVVEQMVADTGLQLRPAAIATLCAKAAEMILAETQKAAEPQPETSTSRMQAHIRRWLDVVLDDNFVYTHPITKETRRFGHHQYPAVAPIEWNKADHGIAQDGPLTE